MRILCFVCVIFASGMMVLAQSNIVTNLDLEKYRIEREKAKSDYRENYAKRGFPSPEELDKRNERDRQVLAETAARVRAERLERERINAEYEAVIHRADVKEGETVIVVDGVAMPTYYGNNGRRYRYPQIRHNGQSGYFAGGQFWPTPTTRTPPKAVFLQPRK